MAPRSPERGRLYRRCGCRRPDGRQFGASCPKLKGRSRHGSWAFAVGLPSADGRRKPHCRSGFPTRKDAHAALKHALTREDTGLSCQEDLALAVYLTDWLRAKEETLKPTTFVRYRDYVRADLIQGITEGAPDAVQVSDRFHLWQGLSKRVADIAAAHRGCLAAAVPEPEPAPPPPDEPREAAETPARRHAKRLFETVQGYTGTARSLSAIARELGLNRRTVAKYARAACWQECIRRTPPRRSTSLDPYLEYLRQRWEEGEHTATVLHQEIAAKGYRGHYQRVKMAIAPLRRGLPIDTPRERPPSPRHVARWITTTPPRRGLHATEALRQLLEHCPELDQTHTLVRQFAAMLDARDAAPLPDWLDHLAASGLPALASLANAIREDQPAVVQGITTPFNSGVNEGRITDLKLQKRIMAGRAGVPLLRHRVVLMAHLRRRYP
ncbi:hypothetical protein [Streptomyces sp. NPDC047043]|uniref:hypothetical protein n=1 Tax=Streptomyces sp. NPDC047043 TaxID=3154497 RepID=UPI0033F1529F